MVKSKLILLVMAAAVALILMGSNPIKHGETKNPAAVKTYGFDYYPMDTMKTMIYDSNFGVTKSHVEKRDGEFVVVNESEDFKYIQKFILKDSGIYITQTEQQLDVFLFISSEAKIRYSEPALRLPLPLHPGREWHWRGTEYKDDDSSGITINGKFKGIDSLITPAGTFECVNIELHVDSEKGSKSIVNEWLAPGIGLVQLTAEIEGTGLVGMLQGILGYDTIYFRLREII